MRNSETALNVNMSLELRNKIEDASKKEGVSKSSFVRSILVEYFENMSDVETQYSSMSVNLDNGDKGWLRKLLKI